jgi:hypothetical protein
MGIPILCVTEEGMLTRYENLEVNLGLLDPLEESLAIRRQKAAEHAERMKEVDMYQDLEIQPRPIRNPLIQRGILESIITNPDWVLVDVLKRGTHWEHLEDNRTINSWINKNHETISSVMVGRFKWVSKQEFKDQYQKFNKKPRIN